MTNTMILDTLRFSQKLQKAGLDPKIADTLTEEIKNLQEDNFEKLATKQDLRALEDKLTIRIGAMLSFAIAIVAGLQKLL